MAQRDKEIVGVGAFPAPRDRGTVVVSGLASDAHTWNLVYLQLVIEELGYRVVNLGPCVPDDVLVAECRRIDPALVVIGSVNGHGRTDGLRAIARLRACPELAATPMVIGGKLTVSDENVGRHARALVAAGFDAVFPDQASDAADFTAFVASLPPAPQPALSAGRFR
ncbi:cobalamin B12-binding domain-containing protein [Streptomyces sp. NPDC056309]|uniref:cobalamin B12-binding domain-containing protein n=1 Tax=unclassified Streptomyces TaxID=2593676 RepID=UPI0035DD09F2